MLTDDTRPRRPYNSPLRRQRAEETRDRIVTAGAALLHGVPIWNWRALTVHTAVAERAGVNERTVYRHFENERVLRDAVLARLEEEAGVVLEGLTLEGIPAVTARILEYVSSFPFVPRSTPDPTVAAANERQRSALLAAITPATDGWSDDQRAVSAAVLDVLWGVVSYEKLVAEWGLEPRQAIAAITWAIELVEDGIQDGHRPRIDEGPSS